MCEGTVNWGERYYDHYVRYFGNPIGRDVFRQSSDEPSIQVLMFDKVFAGCRVFATLGLTHYAKEVRGIRECFMPVDDGWDEVPVLLANAMFYAVQNDLDMRRGLTISGMSNISAGFAATYNKEAIYIADPYGLPDGLNSISGDGEDGELYVGLLISKSEHDFKLANGGERLEDLLEQSQADPYAIRRRAVI